MAAGSMVNVTRVRPTDRYFRRCNSIPYRYSAVGIATTVIECPRISLSYIPTPVEELLVKRKKWEKKKKKTSFIRFDCIVVTDPLVRLTDLLILLVRFARLICPITTILIYLPR